MNAATNMSVEFVPLLPLPVLLLVAFAALALASYAWMQKSRGGVLRALAAGVILLALAGPRYAQEDRKDETDIAIVLVDRSPSQSVGDRMAQTDLALATIRRKLEKDSSLELRVIETEVDAQSDQGTMLMTALRRASADIPADRYAGSILITDGQVHDVAENPALEALPVGPIHVLLSGEKKTFDRRLVIEQAPDYGLVGKTVDVRFRVEGRDPDRAAGYDPVLVRLRVDGRLLETKPVQPGSPAVFEFEIEHAGKAIVEIIAEVSDGEISALNNTGVATINGVRDRLRVLLVSGIPHAGERTWRNLLKSDPAVDLVHFTILRPPEKSDFTPIRELSLISFPTLELFDIKIDEFDLMVFDRYVVRQVLTPRYFSNIANYVRSGGALLLASGPEFAGLRSLFETALGDILPVTPTGDIIEQGFRPSLTEAGLRHPVTAGLNSGNTEEPQWGRWFRQIETNVRGGGITLMNGWAERPLLVLDRVGEGRVGVLTSEQIWLWARGFEGGGPQGELVRRLAHWLMKEPALEEESLRATVDGTHIKISRTSLETLPSSVTLATPDGQKSVLPLEEQSAGVAVAGYISKQPGVYKISDGVLETLVAVGARNPLEYQDLRATRNNLEPVVKQFGGAIHWIADGVPELRRVKPDRKLAGRNWLGLRANGSYSVSGLKSVPVLPGWLAALLGVVLMCAAWWREGG